ncbi:o-succinylbenzoate synthase [Myxococcota bacterium]|nr:o-succinylbenzoate synthase [Myxococcota bacterium]
MRIREATLTPYALPLRRPLATAAGLINRREGLVLRLVTEDGVEGLGECAPLPGFSALDLPGHRQALEALLAKLRGAALHPEDAQALGLPPAAAFAVEQALWDNEGRRRGLSVARLLRPDAAALVPCSRLVRTAEEAVAAQADGVVMVKLKVAVESVARDLARVAALRAAAPGLRLRLDANRGWTFEEAQAALTGLASLGVESVEEPLVGSDLAGLRALRALGVPLLADESARDEDDVARLIDAEAVDGVVLKPMFIGGLKRALRLAERAAAAGLAVVVTTALDAAIGRAGALHVAAACPEAALWPCGLDTGGLLERDLFVSERVIGGALSPRGPGLGLVEPPLAPASARLFGSPTP